MTNAIKVLLQRQSVFLQVESTIEEIILIINIDTFGATDWPS
jgi:hypothetical protein